MIENIDFLTKYDVTTESILNNTSNKIGVEFKNKCIYLHINHYYISGPTIFALSSKMLNTSIPMFLKTNPFYGLFNLPFYIYDLMSLKKRKFIKTDQQLEHVIVEKQINVPNKRFYLYFSILNKVYNSLQLNRPMTAALSIAFDELPYIHNNVGLLIITYDITDTVESLEKKIKKAYYQAYCSNFIINCPIR